MQMQQDQRVTMRQRLHAAWQAIFLWLRGLLLADYQVMELLSAALMCAFGLVLLIPSWNVLGNVSAYRVMANLGAPTWAWGSMFVCLALFEFVAMTARGTDWMRMAGMFGLMFGWYFIATMIFLANFASTGPYTYFLIGLFSTGAWLRRSLKQRRV